ncbi:MAG: hypothetical protein ROZ37_04235 [Aromatoleum sp.]|jgi:hypothetical protein|uniref:hypothetical protein n=1 Tax=Aromatoleum sp. TaxID=2307007 RepID=UPI0028949284|nr:hypothetical protein [Aromatoleum sp.]MDT3669528.1 hypothetical protein [Aromatoleum sp.]
MSIAPSRKSRLRHLEAARSQSLALPLAERLRQARRRIEIEPRASDGERLQRYEALVKKHPHNMQIARLLRAVRRVAAAKELP